MSLFDEANAAVGSRYGRLLLRCVHPRGPRTYHPRMSAACDCGQRTTVRWTDVKRGFTVSCGCYTRDLFNARHRKHGLAHTPEWDRWRAMVSRCTVPTSSKYADYGGRGIRVCERWRSFENFFADMGQPPTPQHELGRTDNDGHYEPGNVRWVTGKENMRNRRTNHLITARGETRCLAEWAEIAGINRLTFANRIARGWDPERALSEPVEVHRPHGVV